MCHFVQITSDGISLYCLEICDDQWTDNFLFLRQTLVGMVIIITLSNNHPRKIIEALMIRLNSSTLNEQVEMMKLF